MPPMDRPKRMLVRTSLVAGSTVATLIGAQTLITVDQQDAALKAATAQVEALSANTTAAQSILQSTATMAVINTAPTIQIVHIAPSITVLRQPGQASANQAAQVVVQQPNPVQVQAAIKPPVPVQIAAPAPVIIQQSSGSQASAPSSGGGGGGQQPSAPATHSSR